MFLNFIRTNTATLIGYTALLLWSTGALVATKICHLPVFQVLTTSFSIAFLTVAAKLTLHKRWSVVLSQPWYVWAAGILGVCGQQVAYLFAFKNGPAMQVDIIILLWPILIVFFSWLLLKEKLKSRHILSCVLGFSSVILLNMTDQGFSLFSAWYSGYTYALICAFLWGGYNVFARYMKTIPAEMIGMYYGVGAIIVFITHITTEEFVVPGIYESLSLLYLGLMVTGMAYLCWDFGVKKGNMKVLATLSYGNSITSLSLLILFADVALQDNLAGAGLLVVFAGLFATDSFVKKLPWPVRWVKGFQTQKTGRHNPSGYKKQPIQLSSSPFPTARKSLAKR